MRRHRRRRRLSMTSLIDVIFLLLLFFMLSSTFTRFAEVELAGAGSGGGETPDSRHVFLSLAPQSLRINGDEAAFSDLPDALSAHLEGDSPLTVLVSLQAEVSAQRLTDLLVALRALPGLQVTVLEAA